MTIKKLLLAFAALVVSTVGLCFGLLAWTGAFGSVQVTEREVGPLTIVYAEHTGDYRETAALGADVFRTLAGEYGIKDAKGFGLYLSDPSVVRPEELKSLVGCVVDDGGGGEAMKVKLKAVAAKFSVATYGPYRCLVAEFPFRNRLAPVIGVLKAYPALKAAASAKGYRLSHALEVYDSKAGLITYALPIQDGDEPAPLLELPVK